MTTITSRRHPTYYVVLSLLHIAGIMPVFAILFLIFTRQWEIGIFIFAVCFVFSVFGFSTISDYRKNSPKIIIEKDKIEIGNRYYFPHEIENIVFTGKRNLGSNPMESMLIQFKSGKKIVIFDNMYSNISEIKQLLEQVILNEQEYNPIKIKKVSKNDIRFEKEEKFKGPLFLSFSGIFLYGFIGFFIFLILTGDRNQPLINSIIAVGVWMIFLYSFLAWQMDYFGLKRNFLIIRNHNHPITVKVYRLSDIREVVFEQKGRLPNCMRVITVDYKKKLHFSQTLRKKTWIEMKKRLEESGVKVRDEIYFYENLKKKDFVTSKR